MNDRKINAAVSLALDVEEALGLMASGRIEQARMLLEDGLRFAAAVNPGVSRAATLSTIRHGAPFEAVG